MDKVNLDYQLRSIHITLQQLELIVKDLTGSKRWHIPHALDLIENGKQHIRFCHEELLKIPPHPINSQE